MTAFVQRNGLHVPATAAHDTPEENTVTDANIRPMRWTSDDRLETDPNGIPPVRAEAARSPLVWLKRRSADVAQQLAMTANPRVTKAEARLVDAEALERADADPRSIARANRTAKRWSMIALLGSIGAGLLISSSTAQQTIAETLGWVGGLGFYLAYLADPAIGVPLFAMLGVTSLATQRGVQLPPEAHRAFKRCEIALFVLVALLNGGPAVASALRSLAVLFGASPATLRVMDTAGHGFLYAVIHLIGPVLVGTVIWALPHVSGALALISSGSHAASGTPSNPAGNPTPASPSRGGVTPPQYSENAPAETPAGNPSNEPSREDQIVAEVARLVTTGEWTWPISARRIRDRFRCGTEIASNVRDRVKAEFEG